MTNAQENQIAMDHWLRQAEEEDAAEILIEQLQALIKQPVAINHCSSTELYALCMLDNAQLQFILEHRNQYGGFLSIYELQQLPHILPEDLQALQPFIRLDGIAKREKISHELYSSIELQYPFTKAERMGKYIGNSLRNRWRYTYKGSGVELGIRLGKDAGEAFNNTNSFPFMDHSSAYLYLKNVGKVSKLIIGDMSLGYGQGLHLNTAAFVGGITGLERNKINAQGISPYRSNNPDIQWTGIGMKVEGNVAALEYGFATQKRDASITDGKLNSLGVNSGLHRSISERKKRASTEAKLWFADLQLQLKRVALGVTASYWCMNREMHNVQQAYQRYEDRRSTQTNISAHYEFGHKNVLFYGELMPSQHKLSFIQGVLLSLGKTDICMAAFSYPLSKAVYTKYSFSKWSNTAGESGHFLSIKQNINHSFQLSYSLHNFHSNWLRSNHASLIHGSDHRMRLVRRFGRDTKLQIDMQWRPAFIQKSENADLISEQEMIKNVRWSVQKKLGRKLEVRCRAESKWSSEIRSGMLYLDVRGRAWNLLNLTFRASVANIPQSELAIYSYERAPIGMNPSFAYFYSGSRNYVFVHRALSKHIDLWFKYGLQLVNSSLEVYHEPLNFGSGDNMRLGNRKHTFALQLRYSNP